MADAGGPRRGLAVGELLIGLGVVGLAAVVAVSTALAPDAAAYARVGPKAVPWIVAGLLALLGSALAATALRGGWPHEEAPERTDWRALAWLGAGLGLNAALIESVGFILASTLLFACVARGFGSRRPPLDLALGFALALSAYVGFDRAFGYRLGSGPIERLL